ncbi:hypothetical protein [Agrococcus sp. DT81.2]|uniref:hypothetical protein n=1 Tax=Agrococcus sp. DT81.2 TaxID=3393414 RepID=UPI003CE587CF
MSDEQHTSWRDRFFGSGPAKEPAPEAPEARDDAQHSAELAPDEAEVAATSVAEHDEHQPLVEHDAEAHQSMAQQERQSTSDADRSADSPIEPTVIAPSTLRGPSHSAAHPDDTVRTDTARFDAHRDAATSSLERVDDPSADGARGDDAPTQAMPTEPPPLVEPRRPSFGLRRQAPVDAAAIDTTAVDAAADDTAAVDTGTDSGAKGWAAPAPALGGLAAAGATGAGASVARDERREREFVEPEPTQAIEQQRDDDSTRAIDTDPTRAIDTDSTRAIDTDSTTDTGGATRVLPTQEPAAETRPQRFGIVSDGDRAPSTIPVDDETASATAAGGTPIVLVEEPVPPRRKGARAVGFAVALLATLIFAILFAAAFFAVGYLFDRAFDPTETLQTLWLRPSFLLPVIVFFLAYWIVTLVVNRAGWWAHVLGAFIVALLVYVAHIGGAYMEAQGGWAGYTALPGIDAQALSQLLLAPLSVLAFVIAREVPVWVGGIVARRGRKAREWNRKAMDDFNAENAERLAMYERARG